MDVRGSCVPLESRYLTYVAGDGRSAIAFVPLGAWSVRKPSARGEPCDRRLRSTWLDQIRDPLRRNVNGYSDNASARRLWIWQQPNHLGDQRAIVQRFNHALLCA